MPDDKAVWSRLGRGPKVTEAQARRALGSALPDLAGARLERLSGGLRNTNFRVHSDRSGGSAVLRFYEAGAEACAREAEILRLLHGEVPVPEVFLVRPDGTDGGRPFLVMEFIDGISFRMLLDEGDGEAIGQAAYAIGRTLAVLGRRRFPAPGLLGPDLTVGSWYVQPPDAIPKLVDLCLSRAAFRKRVDAGLAERVRGYAWSWALRLADLAGEAHLVHADFNAPNILVRSREGRWEVAAVLDWEFAFAGSPSWDLGNFLRYERSSRSVREPHFSRGCIDGGIVLAEDWRGVARVHDLVSICEILSRDELPEPIAIELRELAQATIEERDPALF